MSSNDFTNSIAINRHSLKLTVEAGTAVATCGATLRRGSRAVAGDVALATAVEASLGAEVATALEATLVGGGLRAVTGNVASATAAIAGTVTHCPTFTSEFQQKPRPLPPRLALFPQQTPTCIIIQITNT